MELSKQNNLRVLSLFSGAGGMDLGLEGGFLTHALSADCWLENFTHQKFGEPQSLWVRVPGTRFKTIFANDINKDAKTAWTNYFAMRDGRPADIYHLESVVDLVKRYETGDKTVFPKDIDVVTGGFPCQDFSVAGKRLGFNSNKNDQGTVREDDSETSRGKLYYWMKRVIDIVRPKLFIAENVKGLLSLSDAFQIIREDFSKNGYYVVEPQILRAWEFGVPEKRERVIFIGVRQDALNESVYEKLVTGEINLYPEATHSLGHNDELLDVVTCRDVLSHLKEPSEEVDDLSQMCYSTAKYLGRKRQGQTEISWNGLAPTIRSEHHGNIEYRRLSKEHGGEMLEDNSGIERRLTPRECALIQTFPLDYEFVMKGDNKLTQSAAYKIIGNAVPPVLAYKIALHLEELWDSLFK